MNMPIMLSGGAKSIGLKYHGFMHIDFPLLFNLSFLTMECRKKIPKNFHETKNTNPSEIQ